MAAINKTTYLCEAVTPMFIYGAASLELRTSSLKGLVRYWWRALNGHLPVKELREKEELLFGSGDEKLDVLRSCCVLFRGRCKSVLSIFCPTKIGPRLRLFQLAPNFR